MADNTNQGGRPPITPEEKAKRILEMSRKLEPYLKSGLSIRKALREAKISKDSFYRIMVESEGFRDTISQFRNFISVLLNSAIVRELQTIIEKQNGHESLSNDDRKFLMWFALNSNLCREEYGRQDNTNLSFDPEESIQRVKELIEKSSTQKIYHI